MKKIIFLFLTVLSSSAFCFKPVLIHSAATPQAKEQPHVLHISEFISSSEAEKILELPVHLKDSTYKTTNLSTRFQFNYKVNATKDTADPAQYRSLFFAYEEYNNIDDAVQLFSTFKKENAKLYAVSDYTKAGDDGFFFQDKFGTPSIFIRKGNKTFKFRLNNLPGKKALEKLEAAALKVVSQH